MPEGVTPTIAPAARVWRAASTLSTDDGRPVPPGANREVTGPRHVGGGDRDGDGAGVGGDARGEWHGDGLAGGQRGGACDAGVDRGGMGVTGTNRPAVVVASGTNQPVTLTMTGAPVLLSTASVPVALRPTMGAVGPHLARPVVHDRRRGHGVLGPDRHVSGQGRGDGIDGDGEGDSGGVGRDAALPGDRDPDDGGVEPLDADAGAHVGEPHGCSAARNDEVAVAADDRWGCDHDGADPEQAGECERAGERATSAGARACGGPSDAGLVPPGINPVGVTRT